MGLEIPKIVPKDPLQPYEPTPRPELDPRPTPDPRPEINLKEVPPLLKELEVVVMSPYNGQSLETLKLTQQAWYEVGISPREVRDKVTKDVIPLGNQHLLVRVVGKSENGSGNINLLQVISNRPSALKPYYRSPVRLAEDTFALATVIGSSISNYFENDEYGKKITSNIPVESMPLLKRAVLEKILNSNSGLASAVFVNLYAVFDSKLFEKMFEGRPANEAISFRAKYAILISERDIKDYHNIAEGVAENIKAQYFNDGVIIGNRNQGYDEVAEDLNALVRVIRALEVSVPEEMFKLRDAKQYIALQAMQEESIKARLRENKSPISMRSGYNREEAFNAWLVRGRELSAYYDRQIRGLEAELGNPLTRDVHSWDLSMEWKVIGDILLGYNLGKKVEYNAPNMGNPK